jgi:hypothetical protein
MDEQGGEFSDFANNVYSDITSGNFSLTADFGWIRKSCSTGYVQPYYLSGLPAPFGGYIYGVIKELEVEYSAGRVKFTIKAIHATLCSASTRVNLPFGSDDQRMRLVPAIRQLHSRTNPPVQRTQFQRMADGTLQEYSFRNSEGGRNGPYSTWAANQQQPLAASRTWLNSLTTDRDKGVYTILPCMQNPPTILFMEDPTLACNQNPSGREFWGTFIVNGGDCSPVLSFEPKTKYDMAFNLGAGDITGGPGGFAQRSLTSRTDQPQERRQALCRTLYSRSTPAPPSGVQTFVAPPQSDVNWRPPALVAERLQSAINSHLAAQRNTSGTYQPTTAKLKIQGDPRFTNNVYVGANWRIGIVVVNPFRVVSEGTESCDWLAVPPCNNIFSSDKWRVSGADHQIADGSYTTTLEVALPAPAGQTGGPGGLG